MENENTTVIPEMLISEPKPLPTMQLVLKVQLTPESPLARAVHEFIDRQARKSHPDGSFDDAQRWDPSATEHRDCCRSIREPSRAYPYSLMVHCRTAEHVSNLFGVSVADVRRVAFALRKERKASATNPAVAGLALVAA